MQADRIIATQSTPARTDGVMSALRRAAVETGTDFSYLLNTAMRESSLNPAAQAASSSAAGLFQFIEQTWLGTVREHGAEHGLGAYADAIQVGSNGRFKVADGALRQEILALRKNPEAAALMAGEMTGDMRSDMEGELGRSVSQGELYIAHFLGPNAATKMIKAAAENPDASAARLFPQAAAANRSIFYGKNGEARSVATVAAALTRKHEDAAPASDAVYAEVRTTPWRGATADSALPNPPSYSAGSYVSDDMLILSPMVVQLLASLDPVPDMAAALSEDKPKLRRTDEDLI
jgi:hypothetical protein